MKTALLNTLAWLTGASKTLISFLLPVLASSLSAMLTALAPIAIEVVSSLADSGKTGAEKRSAAVDAIKAQALAVGIAATTSAVNLAVELAVAKLNSDK